MQSVQLTHTHAHMWLCVCECVCVVVILLKYHIKCAFYIRSDLVHEYGALLNDEWAWLESSSVLRSIIFFTAIWKNTYVYLSWNVIKYAANEHSFPLSQTNDFNDMYTNWFL